MDGQVARNYLGHTRGSLLSWVRGQVGSMNGPAPVVAGGMVYVSSFYAVFGLRPECSASPSGLELDFGPPNELVSSL